MFKNLPLKSLIFRLLGNLLLLITFLGFLGTFGPALYQELQFKILSFRNVRYVVPQKPLMGFPAVRSGGAFAGIFEGNKQQILNPIDPSFNVIIPKIGANSKIIPNVDPSNPNEFLPILENAVAHAKGSVFPGMNGTIYLFAHSADNFWNVGRYNAVFYLLKDLSPGDDIYIFFDNKRYNYKVTKAGIINAEETSFLTQTQETGKELLILQTCWPPGTTWKRFVVLAEPVLDTGK